MKKININKKYINIHNEFETLNFIMIIIKMFIVY